MTRDGAAMMRRTAAQLCVVLVLVEALHLAAAVLPAPPIAHLTAWWSSNSPLTASFSLLRLLLIAVAIGWAALLLTMLACSALGAAPRIFQWAGSRSLLRLALGLSASGLTVAACSSPPSVVPPAPTLLNLGPPRAAVPPSAAPPAIGVPTQPVRRIRGPAGSGLVLPTTPVPVPEPAVDRMPQGEGPPLREGAWTVKPGDNLWSISRDVLGPSAPSRVVAGYWLQLIQLNRPHLADPDLIFPGQVIHLPAADS